MIETSCLSRRIVLGDRVAYLSPPTIRQVVEILHVLRQPGSEQNIALLFELLAGLEWKGAADVLIHIRNLLLSDPAGFHTFIRNILMQGYSPEISEKTEEEPKSTGVDWLQLITRYCRAYPGRDPYQVYNETPFTFFMSALPEAQREDARQKFHGAIIASFAMGGSKETLKHWQEQGWPEPKQESEINRQVDSEELASNRKKFKDGLKWR